MRTTVAVVALGCAFCRVEALEVRIDLDTANIEKVLPSAVMRVVEEGIAYNSKGLDALERGDLDAALSFFDTACSRVPGYNDAENNRGVVHYRRGAVGEARRIWQQLTKRDPQYAVAWYNLGLVAFHEKDYEQAQRLLETALKANRQFVEAMVMLGRVLLRRNELTKAVDVLRRAYKVKESDPDVGSHYAYVLILSRDTTGAERILHQHRETAEAQRMLGIIAASRGQHARAAEHFQRAVSLGASPEYLLHLAASLHAAGRNQEARVVIEDYLNAMRKQVPADAWILAGIVANGCADKAAARRYFEQGLEQHPGDIILASNLAVMCFESKDYECAERLWSGIADTIRDPHVAYLRAVTALRRGDVGKAEKLVRDALAIDKRRAEFYDLLGILQYRRGAKDSAVASFRQALQLDPSLRSAQMNLALTQRSAAELRQAIAAAVREREACSKGCAGEALALSVLYYYSGNLDSAVRVLTSLPEEERDERILRHIAIYYGELHQFDKAIDALESARTRFVVELRTEQELADLLLVTGRHKRAVEVLTGMLERGEGELWRILYQLGYAYLELNELDKARELFERSLRAKPDNPASRGLLAYVLKRQGKGVEAQALWERNLKDDPTNPAVLVNLGLAAEERGDYQAALEYYRKAAPLVTDERVLAINIGNAYAGLGHYVDALESYSQALDSPKRMEAAYNAFWAAIKARRTEKAHAMASLLDKEFPSSPLTKRARAELALARGDTSAALAALEGIGEKDGGDCLTLARVYADRRDLAKARRYMECIPHDSGWTRARQDIEARMALAEGKCDEALRTLRALEDTTFESHYNVAYAAFTCGRYGEALSLCQQVLPRTRGRDRADLCRLAGNTAAVMKDWKAVEYWYGQLADSENADALVYYNLAVAAHNRGDFESAWRHYLRARTMDPSLRNPDIERRHETVAGGIEASGRMQLDSLDSLYNRAVELQEKDSLDSAEALYRRIIRSNPRHSLALNNLGALLVQREAYDEAKECYQRALEKRHDLPETYANLVSLYLAEGNLAEAKRWIFKGRGHNPDSELLAEVERVVQDSLRAAERRSRKKTPPR